MPRTTDDDIWNEVMGQVADALDELDLGETRDALLGGVRDALLAVSDELSFEEDDGPVVTVIDGGRDDDATEEVGEREPPDLRVADDPLSEEVPLGSPRVRISVLERHQGLGAPDLGCEGSITLHAGEEQTLYRGHPHAYRICCGMGRLEIAADGARVESIRAGQTIDIVAGLIRVTSVESATGTYARLDGSSGS